MKSAAAARQTSKPVPIQSNESTCLVFLHQPPKAAAHAAIDRTLARMAADKRQGDVMRVLREFRDSPRGE